MIKKMAGAAVGTLLIASMLTGSFCIAGAVTNTAAAPAPTAPETIAAPAPAAEPAADDYTAYLFVHFVGEGDADDEQIYFSVSTDGTNWETLHRKSPVLTNTLGTEGVRDPFIIRKPDNSGFVIIATDLSINNLGKTQGDGKWGYSQTNGSKNIVIWESNGNSLTDWKAPHLAEVGVQNAGCVWAPEAVWDKDKDQYMVFWASKTSADNYDVQRVYRSYTSDFTEFTEPEVYIERKNSMIDTTIYYNEANETYYRFTKDEGAKWVFMEQSKSLDGDFEMVSTYSLNGKHYSETKDVEGPTVYKINGEDKWCMLLDSWAYCPYVTDDITEGKFVSAANFNFNGVTFRHGSVLPLKQSEYTAIMETYGDDDKTTGEKIFELDFEEENVTPSTGSFTATANGSITYTQGVKAGSKAAVISGNGNYINLDPTIFIGKNNLTLSFIVKKNSNSANQWVFYAAPNTNEQDNNHVKYLGVLWKSLDDGLIDCERFYDGRDPDPDAYGRMAGDGTWFYLTVVYYRSSTKVFINGQQLSGEGHRATTAASHDLSDTLGASPVAYLGRANWGSGEYSDITLDAFRVYNYAMPDSEVAQLYATDSATA